MVNVAPSKRRVRRGRAAGKVYESVSSGLRDGPVPTTEIKKDNKEAENRESRLSRALHLAGRKSACTGLSALRPTLLSTYNCSEPMSESYCYILDAF